jgi:hypothetical protein
LKKQTTFYQDFSTMRQRDIQLSAVSDQKRKRKHRHNATCQIAQDKAQGDLPLYPTFTPEGDKEACSYAKAFAFTNV